MLVQLIVLILLNRALCYFYIHEFPLDIESSIPWPNITLEPRGKFSGVDLVHSRMLNYGVGEAIDVENGIYATSYIFGLYQIVVARLRIHPLRTLNKSLASVFFIPYDIEVSAYYDKHNGYYRMHQDGGCEVEEPIVRQLLQQGIDDSKLYGHDHVLISATGTLFNPYCSAIINLCANCTKIASMPSMQPFANSTRRWHGMPMVSAVHWNEAMTRYPWSIKIPIIPKDYEYILNLITPIHYTNTNVNLQYNTTLSKFILNYTYNSTLRTADERRKEVGEVYLNPNTRYLLLNNISYFVTAWFSPHVQGRISQHIGEGLLTHCTDRPHLCKHIHIADRYATQCFGKNATGCESHEVSGMDAYNNSVFCLQPPGDGVPRKGYFDSIAIGCIPVIFTNHFGNKTYSWYYNGTTDAEVSVFISKDYFVRNPTTNVIDLLAMIPVEEIYKKQRAIALLAPSLLYSIPPQKYARYIGYGGSRSEKDTALGTINGFIPPIKDAVDVMLDHVMQYVDDYTHNNNTIPSYDVPYPATYDEYDFWYGEL